MNKIDKLATLIEKKKKTTQAFKSRMRVVITTDPNIKRIVRKYYEKFMAINLPN